MLGLSQRVRSHALQVGVAAFALLASTLLAGCSDAGPSAPKAFDPNTEWQPDVKITYPAPLSENEKARLRLEDLHRTYDGKLEDWAPAPEEIPLEQWRPAEDITLIRECMTESGWPPDENGDLPAFMDGDPNGKPLWAANYICDARFSIDPNDRKQPNNDQLGLEYDYYVQWWIPCLETLGLNNTHETPSRNAYIGSKGIVAQPDGFYWPGQLIGETWETTGHKIDDATIEAKCPFEPPVAAIWGEGNS